MSNKAYKKPPKVKSSIVQYLLVALVVLPFLIWFSISASSKWHLSDALTIFIMCCIMLAAWLCWIGIRSALRKRNKKFAEERKQNRNKN